MLLLGPDAHLHGADDPEQNQRPVLHDQGLDQPPQRLEVVIGARHGVEAEPVRDRSPRAALGAQVAEDQVGVGVGDLREQPQQQQGDDLAAGPRERPRRVEDPRVGGLVRRRGVHKVRGEQPPEDPVVEAVLEHVERRHGPVREPVHKQRLELPLDVVDEVGVEKRLLQEARGERLAVHRVLEEVEPEVGRNGPRVLDQVHGPPPQLRPQVLGVDGEVATLGQFGQLVGAFDHVVLGFGVRGAVGPDGEPDAVRVELRLGGYVLGELGPADHERVHFAVDLGGQFAASLEEDRHVQLLRSEPVSKRWQDT